MERVVSFLFTTYRLFSSPLPRCRFYPSCSSYARQAIEKYGFFEGGLLALKRILSCHPFSKRSIYDPV